MEIHVKFDRPNWRKVATVLLIILAVALLSWLVVNRDTSNIPAGVKRQLPFKAAYAAAVTDYKYDQSQKALSFTVNYDGRKVAVTEQSLPENLSSGSQFYFQALGIRPTAQFTSNIGPVALANFYKPGSLEYNGQAGVAVAGRTLVIANLSGKQEKLTNDQWKRFFDSLKISR